MTTQGALTGDSSDDSGNSGGDRNMPHSRVHVLQNSTVPVGPQSHPLRQGGLGQRLLPPFSLASPWAPVLMVGGGAFSWCPRRMSIWRGVGICLSTSPAALGPRAPCGELEKPGRTGPAHREHVAQGSSATCWAGAWVFASRLSGCPPCPTLDTAGHGAIRQRATSLGRHHRCRCQEAFLQEDVGSKATSQGGQGCHLPQGAAPAGHLRGGPSGLHGHARDAGEGCQEAGFPGAS